MKAIFRSPAKGHIEGRGHHRHLGKLDCHGRFLENAHHHVDIFIGPFRQGYRQKHQVGANRKVGPLVTNNQADAFCFCPLDRLMGHGQYIARYCVHF